MSEFERMRVSKMDWYDIEDTILEKPKEEVDKLVCPECGGKLEITYGMESGSLSIRCLGCGILSRSKGFPVPFYVSNNHTKRPRN